MDIYVGNLPYDVSEDFLIDLFSSYGKVAKANIVKDKETRRSKGFGFVTMDSEDEAYKAINDLNGKEIKGRVARINPAQDKPVRSSRPRY